MKFFGATISLVAVSQASMLLMEQHLGKLYNDTLRSQGISDRNVASMMGPSINVINGYGCWCYRRGVLSFKICVIFRDKRQDLDVEGLEVL